MAFVTLFVPEDFLNIPTHGSIQYHPSLLPKYRGPSAINWPIILGDAETGLSVFWPDNGLDTGDVLLRKTTPIGFADSLGSVYFDRLFPMGVEAMLEAVDLVKAGKAPRIKQDAAEATYEGRCGEDNARIDWGKPWRQIDNLIRGCNPAPGAWTIVDGKTLQVFEAMPMPARDPKGIGGKMGEIVAVEADGFTVVCADGRIKVLRVRPADGAKSGAGELRRRHQARNRYEARMTPASPQHKDSAELPVSQHVRPKSDIEIAQAAQDAPDHRHRARAARHRGRVHRALWPLQGQAVDGLHQVAQGPAEREAGAGVARSPRRRPAKARPRPRSGLTDALNHIGKKAMLCIREPSLGPVLRRQGRRCRRRLRPGGADGGHQSPFHRRPPCHRHRATTCWRR